MATIPGDLADGIAASAMPSSSLLRRWLCVALAGVFVGVVAATTVALSPVALVESEPSGAVVFVDGSEAGRTPLALSSWLPTSWQIRVEAAGYGPWTGTAQARPGQTTRLVAVLPPLPGRLLIEAEPAGARVEVDGIDLGPAPLALQSISAGVHRVVVSAEDHQDWDEEIRIRPGGAESRRIVLRLLPARLTLATAVDGAVVFVDDEERGPASQEIEIEPGERHIRVEMEGHRPWRRIVRLLPNETRVLEIVLQRAWPDLEDEPIYPLAVIIENQDDARPQTGLDRADVVYEALAEGGITRFFAVYATQEPEIVGPVRSARPYFVHWAQQFGAALIHIGGSPQAYAELETARVRSIDAMRGTGVFWRSRDRVAPHNAYTSIAGIRKQQGSAARPGSLGGLRFRKEGVRVTGPPASRAGVKYGPWRYSVAWNYDPYANEYAREMDGSPHVDAVSGQEIRVSNVLIQWVPARTIAGDEAGRLELADVGSGSLLVFTDGVAIEGKWKRASASAPIDYQDPEGNPLRLNAGPTWIHVLPMNGQVVW